MEDSLSEKDYRKKLTGRRQPRFPEAPLPACEVFAARQYTYLPADGKIMIIK